MGASFISSFEGIITKAYRCPAGVITIGCGFTNRSKWFKDYWIKKTGHALRMGDTITKSEALRILPMVVSEEYGSMVAKKLKLTNQYEFDAASSMTFNCGIGALDWKWAKALAAGNAKLSAERIRVTATTGGGKKLAGLVRRRAAEGDLIEFHTYGKYGKAARAESQSWVGTSVDDNKAVQTALANLGYYKGEIDGQLGPKSRKAITEFQAKNGLTVDGIAGPATKATLIRKVNESEGETASAISGVVAAVGTAGGIKAFNIPLEMSNVIPLLMGIVAVSTLVYLGFALWRNRGRITGKRVAT